MEKGDVPWSPSAGCSSTWDATSATQLSAAILNELSVRGPIGVAIPLEEAERNGTTKAFEPTMYHK